MARKKKTISLPLMVPPEICRFEVWMALLSEEKDMLPEDVVRPVLVVSGQRMLECSPLATVAPLSTAHDPAQMGLYPLHVAVMPPVYQGPFPAGSGLPCAV